MKKHHVFFILIIVCVIFVLIRMNHMFKIDDHDNQTNETTTQTTENTVSSEEGETDYILCQNARFELKLPLSWKGHYVMEQQEEETKDIMWCSFYNKENHETDYGGFLFAVAAYPSKEDFEYLPSYDILKEQDGFYYVVEYPTDIQFDPDSKENAKIYQQLSKDIDDVLDTLIIY